MAIEVGKRKYRTLDDNIFVNGQKLRSAYVNGDLVYPEHSNRGAYALVFGTGVDVEQHTHEDNVSGAFLDMLAFQVMTEGEVTANCFCTAAGMFAASIFIGRDWMSKYKLSAEFGYPYAPSAGSADRHMSVDANGIHNLGAGIGGLIQHDCILIKGPGHDEITLDTYIPAEEALHGRGISSLGRTVEVTAKLKGKYRDGIYSGMINYYELESQGEVSGVGGVSTGFVRPDYWDNHPNNVPVERYAGLAGISMSCPVMTHVETTRTRLVNGHPDSATTFSYEESATVGLGWIPITKVIYIGDDPKLASLSRITLTEKHPKYGQWYKLDGEYA